MSTSILYKLNRRLLFLWKLRDEITKPSKSVESREKAVQLAMDWLIKAQDVTETGGYSAGFDLRNGWLADFPETTGYIIPTFYDLAELYEQPKLKNRAVKALDWLLDVQNDDGSISGFIEGARRPIVYDTGQVLFGLVRGFQETKDEKYLTAAQKAGNWLYKIVDEDGKWSRHTYCDLVHTYNTRVAWSLLELFQIDANPKYREVAEKNIEWAITQQDKTGWYENNIFEPNGVVFTHATSYATRGILECGLMLENKTFINQAQIAADAMLDKLQNGRLPAVFKKSWMPASNAVCLTGEAQAVIIWLKLFLHTKEEEYLMKSTQAIDFLIQTQEKSKFFPAIHGAIKGSDPIDGPYLAYSYPNWAPKFFIDAILLERRCLEKQEANE